MLLHFSIKHKLLKLLMSGRKISRRFRNVVEDANGKNMLDGKSNGCTNKNWKNKNHNICYKAKLIKYNGTCLVT